MLFLRLWRIISKKKEEEEEGKKKRKRTQCTWRLHLSVQIFEYRADRLKGCSYSTGYI